MYSDYASYQLPVREFVSQEFSEGRFPHWIPWLGCGIPLHATQQAGLCYPLLTPLLVFFNANAAIRISLFAHVILGFLGQYRLGRQLTLSVSGSALAALISTQSGFVCSHLAVGHIALVLAYSLIPWLLSSVVEICEAPSLRGTCRFSAVVAALLLVGHPQVPYYALLFGGLWAAASLAIGRAALSRTAVISAFGAGLCPGIAMAAVQLLPALNLHSETALRSMRGTAEYAATYAISGMDLYRLFFPSLFGNPMANIPEFMAPDFYHEKVCYPGVMCWCLAVIALFSGLSRRWPWGAAGLVILGIVVSLGNSTSLFSWLCSVVPGLILFRCPRRCLAMVSILMALLAGRGFDAMTQASPALGRWAEARMATVLLFLAVAVGFLADDALAQTDMSRWAEFAETHLRWELVASVCALAAAIVVIRFMVRVPERMRLLMVTLVVVMDLGYFNLHCIQYEEHQGCAVNGRERCGNRKQPLSRQGRMWMYCWRRLTRQPSH